MIGELDRAQVDALLERELIGRIGCHADGVTYVVPVNFVYEAGRIYVQSADGRKVSMMRKNPAVCFEVEHVEGLLRWQTAIAWGRYRELEGEEARQASERVMLKLRRWSITAEEATRPLLEAIAARDRPAVPPVVFCIDVESATGRWSST